MKSVLITGASRGIGRATAIRAAQEGWSVAVNYRVDRVAADATLAAVQDKGAQGVLVPGDVTSETEVAAMFREAASALGPITGVVINAGIVAPSLRLAEMDATRIRRMFEVNVIGAYLTAREAARTLARSAGGGRRFDCSGLLRGGASGVSLRIRRLRRLEGRAGCAGCRVGEGTCGGRRAGQRGSPWNNRHRNPCQRRTTGPRRAPWRRHADGASRTPRRGCRSDRLAAERCSVLCDRVDPGRQWRALAGAPPRTQKNRLSAVFLQPIDPQADPGGYGWTRTTDPSIMSAVL